MLDQKLYPLALELARSGANRETIIQRLMQEKLDDLTAAMVADRALGSAALRTRIKGASKMVLGGTLLALGVYSFPRARRLKMPILLTVFGLTLLGTGFLQVVRGRG